MRVRRRYGFERIERELMLFGTLLNWDGERVQGGSSASGLFIVIDEDKCLAALVR